MFLHQKIKLINGLPCCEIELGVRISELQYNIFAYDMGEIINSPIRANRPLRRAYKDVACGMNPISREVTNVYMVFNRHVMDLGEIDRSAVINQLFSFAFNSPLYSLVEKKKTILCSLGQQSMPLDDLLQHLDDYISALEVYQKADYSYEISSLIEGHKHKVPLEQQLMIRILSNKALSTEA